MNLTWVARSPQTAALMRGWTWRPFVGQAGRVGGRWLPFTSKFWSHGFVWSQQACGARNLLWAQSQKKEKSWANLKTLHPGKQLRFPDRKSFIWWNFSTPGFQWLTLQNFCINVIKLRCKVSPTGCSIVVFSHSDKSRKQPLQRRRRRRKRPLVRSAWMLQASQHFYQVWISYWKGNKEQRWRPFSRY